jgi:hypothetical protein
MRPAVPVVECRTKTANAAAPSAIASTKLKNLPP